MGGGGGDSLLREVHLGSQRYDDDRMIIALQMIKKPLQSKCQITFITLPTPCI